MGTDWVTSVKEIVDVGVDAAKSGRVGLAKAKLAEAERVREEATEGGDGVLRTRSPEQDAFNQAQKHLDGLKTAIQKAGG